MRRASAVASARWPRPPISTAPMICARADRRSGRRWRPRRRAGRRWAPSAHRPGRCVQRWSARSAWAPTPTQTSARDEEEHAERHGAILAPHDRARSPTASAYRPALDGVRAIAILMVLLVHTGAFLVPGADDHVLPGGALGVDLFFVLSGFLITSLLLERRGERHPIASFYLRRALRLLPAVVVLLVGTAVIALAEGEPARTVANTFAAVHDLHDQLGAAGRRLHRAPPHAACGRWPSRSSSTRSGRCCCSGCWRPARERGPSCCGSRSAWRWRRRCGARPCGSRATAGERLYLRTDARADSLLDRRGARPAAVAARGGRVDAVAQRRGRRRARRAARRRRDAEGLLGRALPRRLHGGGDPRRGADRRRAARRRRAGHGARRAGGSLRSGACPTRCTSGTSRSSSSSASTPARGRPRRADRRGLGAHLRRRGRVVPPRRAPRARRSRAESAGGLRPSPGPRHRVAPVSVSALRRALRGGLAHGARHRPVDARGPALEPHARHGAARRLLRRRRAAPS